MAANTQNFNWSTCREGEMVEDSALSGTDISLTSIQGSEDFVEEGAERS